MGSGLHRKARTAPARATWNAQTCVTIVAGLTALTIAAFGTVPPAKADPSSADPRSFEAYQDEVDRIFEATLAGNNGWTKLLELCDGIGPRLAGSESLERAVEWAAATLRADGHRNVHLEPVMVPHWVRGRESLRLLHPYESELSMLGLGGSVGTPPDGIQADVVVVSNRDELDQLPDSSVEGRIVLYNAAMPLDELEPEAAYSAVVRHRSKGAQWAAERGAVASLVRSLASRSLRTPHTGGAAYGESEIRIPTAALSVEDAEHLDRLQARGVVPRVDLRMEAETLPDARSANVVAELRGTLQPEEVVLLTAHIDSWDVGQGAHDDGAGTVMAMEALNVLRKLGLLPRRTIRVVLWTNEENGTRGVKAYRADHADDLPNHVAAIESDWGCFQPTGIAVDSDDPARTQRAIAETKRILALFPSLGGSDQVPLSSELVGDSALDAWQGDAGVDISHLKREGVLLFGHEVDKSRYFDYHHSTADTVDKIDPRLLSINIAFLAAFAYILADVEVPVAES